MGLLVQQGCWSLVSLTPVSTLRGQWPLRDGNYLFLATEKKTRISLSPQRLCLLRPVLGPVHGTPCLLSFTGYHLVSTYSKPSVLYSFSLIFITDELKSILFTQEMEVRERKWSSLMVTHSSGQSRVRPGEMSAHFLSTWLSTCCLLQNPSII